MVRTKPNTKLIPQAVLSKLQAAAIKAAEQAYCPYSRFPVGAAVFTTDRKIFSGCNVENASYGLTICAERNAIFNAVAFGSQKIAAVMIYTPTLNPSAPCGACRQVINEFGPRAEIYSFCQGKRVLHVSITELLKHPFGPQSLL
jgi:cytidine deaminase